jgi:hypothetical protein
VSSSQGPVGATLPTGALVVGWVVVVPVVVAFAVWSSALTGPGLILTVLLVGIALWVARGLLTVTHLGSGPAWQAATLLIAAVVAVPALAGAAVPLLVLVVVMLVGWLAGAVVITTTALRRGRA